MRFQYNIIILDMQKKNIMYKIYIFYVIIFLLLEYNNNLKLSI